MNIKAWLEAEEGRATAMADHFDITLSAISQWKTNGVPRDRMTAVRDFTRGDVSTLEDMLAPQAEAKAA